MTPNVFRRPCLCPAGARHRDHAISSGAITPSLCLLCTPSVGGAGGSNNERHAAAAKTGGGQGPLPRQIDAGESSVSAFSLGQVEEPVAAGADRRRLARKQLIAHGVSLARLKQPWISALANEDGRWKGVSAGRQAAGQLHLSRMARRATTKAAQAARRTWSASAEGRPEGRQEGQQEGWLEGRPEGPPEGRQGR